MEIREATINDLKTILSLNQQLFDYECNNFDKTLNREWPPNNKEYFKKSILEKNSLALIAVINKKPVGYLVGTIKNSPSYRNLHKIAELENVFILIEHRKQGIGTVLCQKFLEWAKNKGVQKAKVEADAKNKGAIACYQKTGFTHYHTILEINL